MELSEQNLLEELIMAPKIDAPFPNEILQNTWNSTPFDQTLDKLYPPLVTSSFFDAISPQHHFANPYDDAFEPFLDVLSASPERFGSLYETDDLSPVAFLHRHAEDGGEVIFLDNYIVSGLGCELGHDINADSYSAHRGTPSTDVEVRGEKKGKPKKRDGQPSKNLMAERRRRKRLNDRLSMLRSIVPKISKMDRTSILGDTIDYVKELLDKIQKMRGEVLDVDSKDQLSWVSGCLNKDLLNPDDSQLRNPPKFDVERKNEATKLEMCCAPKPGLLLSTLTTLDALGLDIQQCVVSCFGDFSLQASCFEVAEHRNLVSAEDVKQALFRSAGYGGRCI